MPSEAFALAALDALVIALYVQIDDFLGPRHRGPGRSPKLSDSALITLTVAQAARDAQTIGRSRATVKRSAFATAPAPSPASAPAVRLLALAAGIWHHPPHRHPHEPSQPSADNASTI